jgi:hypothetical protein
LHYQMKIQRSIQHVVIKIGRWMTKIYNLELLRASEGTLSRWSRLHLQSLAPTPVSRRVDVRQAAGRKNNCRIFITNVMKNMLYRPHLVG